MQSRANTVSITAQGTLSAHGDLLRIVTRHNPENPGQITPCGSEAAADHPPLTSARLWARCKATLATRIPAPFFQTFIEPLRALPHSDGLESPGLCLAAPDLKLKRHVERRYLSLIGDCVQSIAGEARAIVIQIEDPATVASALPRAVPGPSPDIAPDISIETRLAPQASLGSGLLAPRRFDLPGHLPAAVNRRDLDLLWQGVFHTGCLTITGPSGSGKTSIARAYVQMQLARNLPARYMTAEDFLTEFSLGCRKRDNIGWRQTLRAHRVLVIDDFQFIKPQALRSQEELQYLVDEFLESGHLLILCSDRDPTDQGLSPALLSRLQAGHRIALAYPGHGEREAILSEFASGLDLSREHISYLAGRIQRDMRTLKSAIRRILHGQALKSDATASRPWTGPELDQLCADLYTRRPQVSPERVRQVVADFFQLTPEAISGPVRDKQHSLARHLTAYLCLEHLQLNLKETALVIGRREHGSVVHARKKIEQLLERDLFFRGQVRDLAARIFEG